MNLIKNKKGISKISIVLIICAVVIIFTTIYVIYLNTPEVKIKNGAARLIRNIESIYSEANENDMLLASKEKPLEIQSDISIQSGINSNILKEFAGLQNILNDSTFHINMKQDLKNKYSEFSFTYDYKQEPSLTASAYFNDNKLYIFLKDIYSKYISSDSDYYSSISGTNNIDKAEYEYLYNKIGKSFKSYINKDYISTSKEEITVGDKKIKTTKDSLLIGKMIQNGLVDSIVDDLNNDTKSLDILIKVINNYEDYGTTDKVKEYLTDLASGVKLNNDETLTFSVYTKGFFATTVMYEFSFGQIYKIQYVDYKNKEYDLKIAFITNEIEYFNITSAKIGLNEYKLGFKYGGQTDYITGTAEGTIDKDYIDLEYNINYDGSNNSNNTNFNGKVHFSSDKIDEKTTKEKINISMNSDQNGTFYLLIDTTAKILDTLAKPDFSYSIDSNRLTSQDSQDILEGIITAKGISDIIEELSEIQNSNIDSNNNSSDTPMATARKAEFIADMNTIEASVAMHITGNYSNNILGEDALPKDEIAILNTTEISQASSEYLSYLPTDTSKKYYKIDFDKIDLSITKPNMINFIIDTQGYVYYNGNPEKY